MFGSEMFGIKFTGGEIIFWKRSCFQNGGDYIMQKAFKMMYIFTQSSHGENK